LDQRHSLKSFENKQDYVFLDDQDIYSVEVAWGYCLVGYFARKYPRRSVILKLCDSWNVRYQFFTHASGWLIFKFADEASREQVLKRGPYLVFGRPLMVKITPSCFEFNTDTFCSVLVSVNL